MAYPLTMSTLVEIEEAVDALPPEQKKQLLHFIAERLGSGTVGLTADGRRQHGVLDIPPVSLGRVLRPLSPEDDLLGEMLVSAPFQCVPR
jgi:hypothetical protein